jgi:PAS domain S-box-containing protein
LIDFGKADMVVEMKTPLVDFLETAQLPLKPLLDSLPCGLIICDDLGVIAYWNEGATRQFQYSKEEMIGALVISLVPDRFVKTAVEAMRELRNEHAVGVAAIVGNSFDVFGLRKDHSEFPIQLAVTQHLLEGEHCYMAVINDVSEIQTTATAKLLTEQLSIMNERLAEGIHTPGKLTDVPFAKRNNTKRRPIV